MSAAASMGRNIADGRRAELRSAFEAAVARGEARPLVVPWCLVGAFVLPALYLAVPHTKRPWLYRARFLVVAAVAGLGLDMMRNTSSTNMACAYATGLIAAWGTVWALTLLVWTRPQFDAERVQRRLVKPKTPAAAAAWNGNGNNGHAVGELKAPDESVARGLAQGYEYYWQAFPADAPFLARLDWAVDLCLAFRGPGWSWALPSVPAFRRPEKPLSGELVDLESIPLASRSGLERYPTYGRFLRARLAAVLAGYVALDFCAVAMTVDPYFVFGPDPPRRPLPAFLDRLPQTVLEAYRSGVSALGLLAALHVIFGLDQVLGCAVLGPLLGVRGELWNYPSAFGSFDQVLDRGLGGFWGGWWHQTFRSGFAAPALWLIRKGYLGPGVRSTRAVVGLVAFAQSGILHASGSITALPRTRCWQPLVFFLLSWAGIVLQETVCFAFEPQIRTLPRTCRRAGNLLFVLLWLHCTRWAIIDDMSRSALWLFEPVPISPLRWLGFGLPGDSWWRWDRDHLPKGWHTGKHWWESGIAL